MSAWMVFGFSATMMVLTALLIKWARRGNPLDRSFDEASRRD